MGASERARIAAAIAWMMVTGGVAAHGCTFSELQVAQCGGFLTEADDACRTCSEAACCAESELCRESTGCAALYDCIDACAGDAGCKADCAAAHPADQAAADLARCEAELCPDCRSCGGYFQLSSPACDTCAASACCAEADACLADPACRERAVCSTTCGTPHCARQCSDLHPLTGEVATAFDDWEACLSVSCRAECELGENFSCVGKFAWPRPVGNTVTFTGRYHTGGEAQAGLTVKACRRQDLSCVDPVTSGTTDDEGEVALTIPVGDSGFEGFFDVAGNDAVMPVIQAQTAPLFADEYRGFDMTSYATVTAAEALLDLQVDLDKGLLYAFAEDCLDLRAPGLVLEIEGPGLEGVTQFYWNNGLPSLDLTETVPGMGGAGWVNVPPGLYTVRAYRADDGAEVALTQLQSRAGTVTSTTLSPKP